MGVSTFVAILVAIGLIFTYFIALSLTNLVEIKSLLAPLSNKALTFKLFNLIPKTNKGWLKLSVFPKCIEGFSSTLSLNTFSFNDDFLLNSEELYVRDFHIYNK